MLERIVASVTLTGGIVWVACLLLFGSDAGLPFFPVVIALAGGGAVLAVLWASRVVVHLVITRRAPEHRRLRRLVAEPLVLLICCAFVWSGAPFWVRFILSRSVLNSYVQAGASTINAGPVTPGARVGLFWVRHVEVLPQGVVRMITTECGVVDSCGLAYSPTGTPPVVGEDVYDSLGGPWYHWYRRF